MQVITRINYGQSVHMSGLAGAVSLAGSGGGLWSISGGNWQMAAGLINRSDVALHLNEEIKSVAYHGDYYELNSTTGKSYNCEVAVIATPLDELNINFDPQISIPERKLQHTYTTFVRGLLNPVSIMKPDSHKPTDIMYCVQYRFHPCQTDMPSFFILFGPTPNVMLCCCALGIFWFQSCVENSRSCGHNRGP